MRDSDGLGAGDPGAIEAMLGARSYDGAADGLAEAYRRFGWMAADLDPLGLASRHVLPDLDPHRWGVGEDEAAVLRAAYCATIGWNFGHIADPERRAWLAMAAETAVRPGVAERSRALDLIARGEALEAAFDRRMPGAKTFGLSGAEGYLVLLDRVLGCGAAAGHDHAIMGGMHRGRLTQMGLVFGKPLHRIIADSMGVPEYPESVGASSDSPYHMGWSGAVETPSGTMRVWVAPHPSHLSVVAPVGQGVARAHLDSGQRVLALALHTDAAFAGQGVNAEMLQLSGLPAFSIGGTVHLMLNNQIGFTTDATAARTARTAADFARVIDAPILHVNGEDPDAVLRVAEIAVAYRERFGADIVVDLIAYRRKGHNEIDQPRFTQPRAYARIDAMAPLSARYASETGLHTDLQAFQADLDSAFAASKSLTSNDVPSAPGLAPDIEATMLAPVETGLDAETLRTLAERITALPTGFDPHPKVADFLARRRSDMASGTVDWATAEALALAACIDAGMPVRLIGQDVMRGAFTQRHLEVHDQSNGDRMDVLSGLGGPFSGFDSPLTENAVLAYEYGYSIARPDGLTIWEAQFGDFLNVAQAIFDQFIICGEDRWLFPSGLVLLLPHGVDGGGPDHATAHPERLLAACARGNIQVVNPSAPANIFHALRRQVMAEWRKPLVVLAPKTLLRHPGARSSLSEFSTVFQSVIAESPPKPRVVLSTGKLAVLLEAERDRTGADVALIRLEQLYPLDTAALSKALEPFADAELIWAQEEPENMGYFNWLDRQLEAISGRRWTCVSRPASPSASSGPKAWDDAHLRRVIATALGLED